jgi:hypothetical protein
VEAGKRAGVHARVSSAGALVRKCLAGVDSTTLQNILMRMPDKVCAVGLASLAEEERLPAYALIAPTKALRIKEEIRLEMRRRTTPLMRGRIIRVFLSYFGKARASTGATGPIWIRPRKRG